MCSSAKPADLNNLTVSSKQKCRFDMDENPNGELFKEEYELNAMFDTNDRPPQLIEYIGLVSCLQIMARELK